ncbi:MULTISPECIES: RDD family protein [unclassified Streptomyces]|uniref:RDD family protein n=1 Tax=unclassified Streptomyces TaxID=2593676 RepID=UPI002E2FD445|nr:MULTISPECIES: RDD family protein [unclassified Streptomyces]WUC66271.1 RDD family protein [Streptomyces sp. NBC_00539]
MTASPGDGEHAAREGYYPDPSIPGYVRYWNGSAWVPGTSRPATPADGAGPGFPDETSATETLPDPDAEPEHEPEYEPEREPVAAAVAEAAAWQADPAHQAGFGGPRDVRVSWGHAEEPAGAPPARAAVAAPPVDRFPAQAPAEAVGILSARSPVVAAAVAAAAPAPAAPVAPGAPAPAPAWPAAPGGGDAPSGVTSSWPEAVKAPRPDPARPRPVVTAPRPAPGPLRPAPAAARHDPAPQAAVPQAPAPQPPAPAPLPTAHAVFERMAERAVRPAGLVRRALARLLDSLVLAAVATGAALPLVPRATAHIEAKIDAARGIGRHTTVWLLDATVTGYLALVLAAVLLFGILYEVAPTARWGRTPGKKLLGVRVLATATRRPPTFGAALGRWLVYAVLGVPGSLWCLVDRPRRQAWHDKAAKTYVAR